MKRLVLITALCLLAGISGATFETDDPSDPDKNVINKVKGQVEEQVIVPVGSNLYAPRVVQGECEGWSLDESEVHLNDNNNEDFATRTTYMGFILKTIDCKNEMDGKVLRLALVKVEKNRLIWVELDRILSTG